jgi:hypothetical protein
MEAGIPSGERPHQAPSVAVSTKTAAATAAATTQTAGRDLLVAQLLFRDGHGHHHHLLVVDEELVCCCLLATPTPTRAPLVPPCVASMAGRSHDRPLRSPVSSLACSRSEQLFQHVGSRCALGWTTSMLWAVGASERGRDGAYGTRPATTRHLRSLRGEGAVPT